MQLATTQLLTMKQSANQQIEQGQNEFSIEQVVEFLLSEFETTLHTVEHEVINFHKLIYITAINCCHTLLLYIATIHILPPYIYLWH